MDSPFLQGFARVLPFLAGFSCAWAVELPQGALLALGDGDFKSREKGQAEVLAWAREQPEPSMEKLLKHSRNSDDPEVRERCMDILRELVMDQYMSEGSGFLGIGYDRQTLEMKNGPDSVIAIQVNSVSRETPAERAGLRANDAIIALNGKRWKDATAVDDFASRVAALKPGTKVSLTILRDGKPLEKEIVLMRRPLHADRQGIPGFNGYDPDAEEKAVKDAYFRDWLSERLSPK